MRLRHRRQFKDRLQLNNQLWKHQRQQLVINRRKRPQQRALDEVVVNVESRRKSRR